MFKFHFQSSGVPFPSIKGRPLHAALLDPLFLPGADGIQQTGGEEKEGAGLVLYRSS